MGAVRHISPDKAKIKKFKLFGKRLSNSHVVFYQFKVGKNIVLHEDLHTIS